MLKGFIFAVTGLSVVCAAVGSVMPDGKTKKTLSFCLACVMVLVIGGAVKQSVVDVKNGFSVINSSENSKNDGENSVLTVGKFNDYSCDNEKLRVYVATTYISMAKSALKKQGILLENAAVSFGENNDKVVPEKFIISSNDLVIIGENAHINIPLKCKELLEKLFYGKNVTVIIDD